MYSKHVGDYDVRISEQEPEREFIEHQEFTWNTLHGRRPPLHSQRTTFECGFQTDLFDTKREVGYIHRPLLKQQEDTIEEQRQEIITFRVPRQSLETTTEETYETIVTAVKPDTHKKFDEIRTQTKHEDVDSTIIKTEITEWSRASDSAKTTKSSIDTTRKQKQRSYSPEELVEEAYEVVSTLTKPPDVDISITLTTPRTTKQQVDLSAGKQASSEDDSSYCEEWTVTEAKRKNDGQTVKTIIDR